MPTKTFSVSACMPVIYSGGDGANPGDLHLPLGKWDPATGIGYSTRLLLKASISLSGMTSITAARLYLYQHTAAGWHAKGSGSVNAEGRRKTSDWSESSPGTSTATDEIYGGDSGTLVSGGFADDGGGPSAINNAAADGTLEYIDILTIARAWLDGSPNYGVMIFAADSSTDPSAACEFYSRRASGKVPYFWIEYETNTAPLAPTSLSPSGGETIHTGRTITFSGTRSDPDGGDLLNAYDLEVWNSGHSSKLLDHTSATVAAASAFSKALTLPSGSNADRLYEWRARTRDLAGVWGPWSGYQAFRPNTVPNTPAAPTVETDTLAPLIGGTFADPDPGNTPSRAQIHVERTSTGADLWLSGELTISATPWSIAYAGSALTWGEACRARIRTRDNLGGWSAWSSWRDFVPTQPLGPDNMTPRSLTTKANTLTPTLTVAHSVAFRNHELEVYAANSLSSTRLWAPAVGADYAAATSKAQAYAGTALAWGGTYYWRARIEGTDGVMSAWSALVPFYVNAEPSAPSSLAARDAAGAAAVESGGTALVTVLIPILEAEYQDPDLGPYADLPSSRVIEIYARNADGSAGALVHTNTLASPPYAVPMTYQVPAAVLVMGNSYLVRWRFADNAARLGPWSGYKPLRVTAAPTVTLTAPAAGAIVTDQTPLLDWAYASTAGKAQRTYEVRIWDLGPAGGPATEEVLAHDSGVILSADTAYLVPPGILADDRAYRWQIDVTDTDGLAGRLT